MHRLVQMTDPTKEPAMPTTDPQLDVRTEPPARRHELIFDTYEPDAGFVLVSDHDPSRSTTSSPPSTPASSAGTTSTRARKSGGCASGGLIGQSQRKNGARSDARKV
jgi:hypothetical protein